MANIANLAIKLSADSTQFQSGLQQAADRVRGFAEQTTTVLSRLSSAALSPAGLIGGLTGGLVGGGFAAFIGETTNKLASIRGEASKAGVSVRDFMELTGRMSAEKSEVVKTGLQKMTKTLVELSSGSKEVESKLRGAGLDTTALQGQNAAEAMRTVAKAFHEANSPIEKARIAFAAFGKSASEIMPVLDKIATQQGGIGGKFAGTKPEDVFIASANKKVMEEFSQGWEAKKTEIASGFAQGVIGVRDFFTTGNSATTFMKGIEEAKANEEAQKGNAARLAELNKLEEAAKRVEAAYKSIQEAEKSIQIATGVAGAKGVGGENYQAFVRVREQQRANLSPDQFARMRDQFTELQQKAVAADQTEFANSIEESTKAMQRQIETFGMSAAEVAAYNMRLEAARRFMDQNSESIARFEAKAKELEAIKQDAADLSKAFSVFDDAKTPLDSFQAGLDKIALFMEKFPLQADDAGRAALKLFNSIESSLPKVGNAQALEKGSSAEISFRARFETSQLGRGDAQERVANAMQALLEQQKVQNELGRRMIEAIQENMVVGVQ